VRDIGIVWVMKKLQSLGENIKLSMMPSFLDDEAVQYLFNKIQMDTQLSELVVRFKKVRHQILQKKAKIGIKTDDIVALYQRSPGRYDKLKSHKRNLSQEVINSKNKDSLLKSMQSKINDLVQTSRFKKLKFDNIRDQQRANLVMKKENDKVNLRALSKMLIQTIRSPNTEINRLQQEAKTLESEILEFKELMQRAAIDQLGRILKEFKQKGYALRYTTTIEKVTNALISKELSLSEVTKIVRAKK